MIAPEEKKGRFNLGRWSRPVTLIGFLWTAFAMFAFILPTSWPITGIAGYFGHKKQLLMKFLSEYF